MSEKNQINILHFFSKTKDKITNENSNTSVNSKLINELEHPQSSSDHVRKNVQIGGEKNKRKISRKYDSSYLKFGFVQEPGNELDPRPLCILYCVSLSNDAMKPLKLVKHLQSKHPDLAKKPLEYFQRMHEGMKKQKSLKNMVVKDKSLLKASYLIAFQIAKNKKLYTIGENLIKPCRLQACGAVLGKQAEGDLYVC